jgi:hypothetical protein
MAVKTRPEESELFGEEPTRETVRVKWVRTDWYWGPECPVSPSHGCLIDIKGSPSWYCRHQEHDGEKIRSLYSDGELQEYAWQKYLVSRDSGS